MVDERNKSDCSGCTACAAICPCSAITMVPDVLGFLYPNVNHEKCIQCGLCDKVCAFNDEYDKSFNYNAPIAYAVRHKNMKEVETSQSGAAFIALSDWILEQGGYVYGACYGNHFKVIHRRANSKLERNNFKGSKYVQSDLNNTFSIIKKDLQSGELVLFSGTPCQTAGLASFIGNKLRKNLYLVDVICHGVASPFLWESLLLYLEKREKEKIACVNFRDKARGGWSSGVETFTFQSEEKKDYKWRFYTSLSFRYSCAKCHFCNLKRPSDVTIGDFWGIEKVIPDLHIDNKGYSLLLCNTAKGTFLLDKVKHSLIYSQVGLNLILQPNLLNPTKLHPFRKEFELDYQNRGFEFVFNKYINHSKVIKVYKKFISILCRLYMKKIKENR